MMLRKSLPLSSQGAAAVAAATGGGSGGGGGNGGTTVATTAAAAQETQTRLSAFPVNHLLCHLITSRDLVQYKQVLRNSSIREALAPLPWNHSVEPFTYREDYQSFAHFNYMHTVNRFPRLMKRDLTILHVLCIANSRGKLDASAKKILKATLHAMAAEDIYVPSQVFFLVGQLPRIDLKIAKFLWAHNLQLIYKTTIETSATLIDYGDEHIWTILSACIEGIMTRYDERKTETVIPLVKMFCDSMRCSFHFFVEVAVYRQLPKLFTFLIMDYQHSAETLRHFLEVCIGKGNIVLAEIVFVKAGMNAPQVLYSPVRIERGLQALKHEESIPERLTPVSFDDMRRWLDFKLKINRAEEAAANQDPANDENKNASTNDNNNNNNNINAAPDDNNNNNNNTTTPRGTPNLNSNRQRVRSWLRIGSSQTPELDKTNSNNSNSINNQQNNNLSAFDSPNLNVSPCIEARRSPRPAGAPAGTTAATVEKYQTQGGRLLQRRQRLTNYMRRWLENKFQANNTNQQNLGPPPPPPPPPPRFGLQGVPSFLIEEQEQQGLLAADIGCDPDAEADAADAVADTPYVGHPITIEDVGADTDNDDDDDDDDDYDAPCRRARQQSRLLTVSQELRRWAEYKFSAVRSITPRSSNVDPIAPGSATPAIEEGVPVGFGYGRRSGSGSGLGHGAHSRASRHSAEMQYQQQQWLAGAADAAAAAELTTAATANANATPEPGSPVQDELDPDSDAITPTAAAAHAAESNPTSRANTMTMPDRRWFGRKMGPFVCRVPDAVVYDDSPAAGETTAVVEAASSLPDFASTPAAAADAKAEAEGEREVIAAATTPPAEQSEETVIEREAPNQEVLLGDNDGGRGNSQQISGETKLQEKPPATGKKNMPLS